MDRKETVQQLSEAEISMILDTYMYMNYQDAREGESLTEILQNLEEHPDYGDGGIHHGEYCILKEAAQNTQVGALKINCQSSQMGYDSGTAACTFSTPQEDTVYVVYRGTGDGEWPDNGIGMTAVATTQQRQALDYFEETIDYLDIRSSQRLIVTGHSKGGNKAQFVTMETKYNGLLDACYSVDGQGFSEAAVDRWHNLYGQSGYEERSAKLHGINGENDFVSVLGHSIIPKEHIRYIETPVENSNFAGFHDIKYMFATREYDEKTNRYLTCFRGRKNNDANERGKLGNYAARLSQQVMELEPKKRDGCAATMMQLMESMNGKAEGINGERLSFSDCLDFAFSGLPVIYSSFLEKKEGMLLVKALAEKDSLVEEIPQNQRLWVDYQKLGKQTQELLVIADILKNRGAELLYLAGRIPFYLSDWGKTGYRIKCSVCALEKMEREIRQIAQANQQAAELYQKWDFQSKNVVSQIAF